MTQRKASPETMARLCEAVDREVQAGRFASPALETPLARYRAQTTPPLRSRAEVDAEIAGVIRDWGGGSMGPFGADRFHKLQCLIAEPTAPEPAPSAEKRFLTCAGCGLTRDQEPSVAVRWDERPRCNNCSAAWYRSNPGFANPLTDHNQDTREERPCGCEEAEALKDQNTELCRLLGHVHGTVAGLAKLLETLP